MLLKWICLILLCWNTRTLHINEEKSDRGFIIGISIFVYASAINKQLKKNEKNERKKNPINDFIADSLLDKRSRVNWLPYIYFRISINEFVKSQKQQTNFSLHYK